MHQLHVVLKSYTRFWCARIQIRVWKLLLRIRFYGDLCFRIVVVDV